MTARRRALSGSVAAPTAPLGRRGEVLIVAAIVIVATLLVAPRLGGASLWEDEAQTALLGRAVLAHGIPLGYDGRNYFSQELGAECDSAYRWRKHNWLPFYVVAGSFALFGEGTGPARLPFAVFGAATAALVYLLARELWKDWLAAAFSAAVLAVSVPFLILSRQSRWYTAAAFFMTLALWGYVRLVAGRRAGGVTFAAGLALLFHTHDLYAGTLAAAVIVHAFGWRRERLRTVLLWTAAAAAPCLPWVVWLASMGYVQQYREVVLSAASVGATLRGLGTRVFAHAFHPALLLAPAGILVVRLVKRRPAAATAAGITAPLSCVLLVLGVTGLGLGLTSPGPYFRILAPLIPLLAALSGRILAAATRIHWIVGLALFALVAHREPMPDYIFELTHDFRGPMEGIVPYLRAHAKPDDIVLMTSGDLPVKFYTGLRVVGGLTGEDLSPASDPDWVIPRASRIAADKTDRIRNFVAQRLDRARYEAITLDAPDTPWENREEPSLHLFRTDTQAPPVVLYRKIR